MRRGRWITVGALGLVLAGGCGSAGGGAGPVSNTTAVVTSPGGGTMETVTTTTTHAPTTTPSPVATATNAPAGPVLPDAQPPSAVSWDDIGTGDLLVVVAAGEETGLELVTEDGTIYELARWPDGARQRSVLDVDIAGRRALIGIGGDVGVSDPSSGTVTVLDLATGAEQEVFAAPPKPSDGVPWPAPRAGFDPAGGDALLVTWTDGIGERIERIDATGELLNVLAGQPADLAGPLTWGASPSGDGLVIGGSDGLRLTDHDGAIRAQLDTPGLHCRPLRAWSGDEVLVRCIVDWDGPYFEQLWLVPLDGSAAAPLTGLIEWGEGDGCGGECGYRNAWLWGDEVLAQWWAHDWIAEIHRVDTDGAGEKLDVGSEPGGPGEPGTADFLIAVEGHRLAVLTRPPGAISGYSFLGWVDDGERTPLLPSIQGLGLLQAVPIG